MRAGAPICAPLPATATARSIKKSQTPLIFVQPRQSSNAAWSERCLLAIHLRKINASKVYWLSSLPSVGWILTSSSRLSSSVFRSAATTTFLSGAKRPMSSSGRGRGAYYKNKYGGGGRGGGRGRAGGGRGDSRPRTAGPGGGSYDAFLEMIQSLDGQSYPAYHDLETNPQGTGWRQQQQQQQQQQQGNSNNAFALWIGRTQSDPFAPPTRCRIVVPDAQGWLPNSVTQNSSRRLAAADYLLRVLDRACKAMGASRSLNNSSGGGGNNWSGPKGGDLHILEPGPHVLDQSAVRVHADDSNQSSSVTIQLTINLPARGRTILGRAAHQIFSHTLPQLVHQMQSLQLYDADQTADAARRRLIDHVDSVEDQLWLQNQLAQDDLVAFLPDGAILPRASGVDDRPLANAVPWETPSSLQRSFTLPNAQRELVGTGIPKGITLICGGGFHGKSTVLQALQLGVYPKVPGDGREFCVTAPQAVKIRAEDGRQIQSVDISSFITNLPLGKDTREFTTLDASGSTSQAANIVEAVELGADTLLVDEDTCATNFMIRDAKMMALVAPDKEPITPFVRKVRALYEENGVSSILVIGGVGDYFDVADHVLLVDSYRCTDATERAKAIVAEAAQQQQGQDSTNSSPTSSMGMQSSVDRQLVPSKLSPQGKVRVNARGVISYGETNLDLTLVEQLVSVPQTRAIAVALEKLSQRSPRSETVLQTLQALQDAADGETGLNAWTPAGQYNGGMVRPRLLELGAAVNRLRREGAVNAAKSK